MQHVAVDVERFWFRSIFAGDTVDFTEFGPTAWKVGSDVPVAKVFDLYRKEIEAANAIIVASPLDTPPAAWPEARWPNWRFHDLREMLLHVITETAVHAGHLDAVRELIDGRQWLVLGYPRRLWADPGLRTAPTGGRRRVGRKAQVTGVTGTSAVVGAAAS